MTFGVSLYLYIDKINAQTAIRLRIPALEKEIDELMENSVQLAYRVENFNNPQHLLELAEQPEYSHLKFPFVEDVMVISTGIASRSLSQQEDVKMGRYGARWPIYLGSKK